MTPEEAQKLQEHITGIAEILYKNTPKSDWVSLETIEKSVREQMLEKVSPQVAFFYQRSDWNDQGTSQKIEKLCGRNSNY